MPVSVETLHRVVRGLPTTELALLGKQLRIDPDDIGVAHQTAMLLCEWLIQTGLTTDGQRHRILNQVCPALTEERVRQGPFRFFIAECRYAGWTTAPGWYDFWYDDVIPELPAPAVTTLLCDVYGLYARAAARLEATHGRGADAGGRADQG